MQSSLDVHHTYTVRDKAAALSAAVAVCLTLALSAPGHAADTVRGKTTASNVGNLEKVVFQVSDADPKTWNQTLNNMKNVQRALGKDKVDIELVVYGWGIGMLKIESAVGNRVDEAVAAGVKVVACEETMHGQKLTKDDMLKSVGYVPAGVIELMKKQQQGYAYIRP